MGTRPRELATALDSIRAQTSVVLDVVVVGNSWNPESLPEFTRSLYLEKNAGIPAGRNRGAEQVDGQYIFFLDDDAALPSTSFLADAIAVIRADPTIGLVQPRVVDPTGAPSPRRWIPRIMKGDARKSSDVFSVWEGATLLPRWVFDATGGWGEPFFYAHEGIELAWRVWDQGLRVRYLGDLVAHHPAINPTRHDYYYRLNARNRVWIAKRNLPWVLVPLYVASWTGIQLLRSVRRPEGIAAWFGGWREGWLENPRGRRRIKWITVWRMLRAGRPPLI